MGATNSSKTRLTPGDITGVRKAAEAAPSFSFWPEIAANTPPDASTPGPSLGGVQVPGTPAADSLFVYLPEASAFPKILLSVAPDTTFQLCQLSLTSEPGAASCTGATNLAVSRVSKIGAREIYETGSLQSLTGSQHDFLVDFGGGSIKKFRMNRRQP